MSVLETSSRNIGREYTYDDVEELFAVVEASGQLPRNNDFRIGTVLVVLSLLDIANGRVASSEGARLRAKQLLSLPLGFLPG